MNTIAYRNQDHRLAYLDFEGEVSGNRGSVIQVLKGELLWICNDPEMVKVMLLPEDAPSFRLEFRQLISKKVDVDLAPTEKVPWEIRSNR